MLTSAPHHHCLPLLELQPPSCSHQSPLSHSVLHTCTTEAPRAASLPPAPLLALGQRKLHRRDSPAMDRRRQATSAIEPLSASPHGE